MHSLTLRIRHDVTSILEERHMSAREAGIYPVFAWLRYLPPGCLHTRLNIDTRDPEACEPRLRSAEQIRYHDRRAHPRHSRDNSHVIRNN